MLKTSSENAVIFVRSFCHVVTRIVDDSARVAVMIVVVAVLRWQTVFLYKVT